MDEIAELETRIQNMRACALEAYAHLSSLHDWELLNGRSPKVGMAKRKLEELLRMSERADAP
jgi:hypothetical protein